MLTDDSPMPFGAHVGKKMKDLPLSYLKWCLLNLKSGEVLDYVKGRAEKPIQKPESKVTYAKGSPYAPGKKSGGNNNKKYTGA